MVRPKQSQQTPTVPSRIIRLKIAASAECDPRSVARYWATPERCHPLLVAAVRRALPLLGIADPHAEAGAQ
jgi:hypothetical protein